MRLFRPLHFFLSCALILCSASSGLHAQPAQLVRKITITHIGPAAASDEMIKANIRVKVGDSYTRTGVDDDVRSLYSTGLFYQIRVVEDSTLDGLDLTYVVQGKPILSEIRLEGNKKYSDRKVRKKLTAKTGEPLEEYKLFTDAREIEKMYQKAGYQGTEVRYEAPVVTESTGRATVTFVIKEMPKVKIDDVIFVGAQAFTQKKLRKTIKTRRHWMFSWLMGSGVLKDEQFEDDREMLADFYRRAGYIDFEIKDVQFEYADPKHLTIHIVVSEGTQYKVGTVGIQGNAAFSTDEIMRGNRESGLMKMLSGEIFTPQGMEQDIQAIRDFYGGRGYIDTWVRPIKNPNTLSGKMDLIYEIRDEDKGSSDIEKIEIQGNTKTKDKVIRRELAVSPGEVFNMVRVQRTKGRLEQMAFFDKVETHVETTDIPNKKNLIIDVEEASTGNIEFGAGFSSVDNLIGFVGFREGNFDLFNPPYFRGGGQKFRINVTMGTRRRDYQITFIEPWFLNRRLSLQTDLFHREFRFFSDIYDIRETGARLSLTKALGSEFLLGTVSYTIENIGIDNVDQERAPQIILDEPENRLVSKIGASLAYDTRNNVQIPNRGQRTELLSELAGGPLGAETDFYKFELRSAWYFPGFFNDHIWEIRGRSGVVETYGSSSGEQVPLFDRFFMGGVGSLRGYKFRDIGPRKESRNSPGIFEPVGGNTYWFGSVEYSIPIIERLRFALFYDIGNVYADSFSFDRSQGQQFFNDNWGPGVRLNIPRLGPLRLDYGIPITHDDFTGNKGRFQFGVSYTADY
ncbi:MAG: outer membrane protein assembly factor BamA [Verrucomicrobia bacterium]|nr:outer membrane protein assembly factor BamA [Verrucomicrobiota bacterium]